MGRGGCGEQMKFIRFFSGFLMLTLIGHAHQDRITSLSEDKLIGLPETFQPSELSIEQRVLRIASKSVRIPDCVWNEMYEPNAKRIMITSSWYHDSERLPPYISINVVNHKNDDEAQILLNLKTLEIIDFHRKLKTSESSWHLIHIELEKSCTDSWIVEDIESNRWHLSTP